MLDWATVSDWAWKVALFVILAPVVIVVYGALQYFGFMAVVIGLVAIEKLAGWAVRLLRRAIRSIVRWADQDD